MSSYRQCTASTGCIAGLCLAATVCSALFAEDAAAGERSFLVMLANSPKQYPGPDREPPGLPTGGLVNRQLVYRQYFDRVDPEVGSFAEYWEEISYGNVTIGGNVTDWVNLPWAIQPPLVDPTRDDPVTGPPVNDDLDDPALRNSPANFYDLNGTGRYEYGAGERFANWLAASIIDRDGDQGHSNTDNGPNFVGPGSFHATEAPFLYPVWKPGERFIDMDSDGRWDALDEANNQMDWDGDGTPDLRGPWVDLDENGNADNSGECLYLGDGDNDGNPDCCPDGPGMPGCERYDPDEANSPEYRQPCPPMNWTGSNGEVIDCNGNLIPDECDISCTSIQCLRTGWLDNPMSLTDIACRVDVDCDMALGFSCDPDARRCRLCGASQDHLPFNPVGSIECAPGRGDGIPDECQYASLADCAEQIDAEDEEDPCVVLGLPECVLQVPARCDLLQARCEYDDSNENNDLDIVEPFENFLRRWDACVFDPEASPGNSEAVNAHWVKVYDPSSPNAELRLECEAESRSFTYGDDSYIRHNYPGRAKLCSETREPCDTSSDCPTGEACRSGVEELIDQAGQTPLLGQHDPYGKIDDVCLCLRMDCDSNADCADLPGSVCRGKETCGYTNPCPRGSECRDPDPSDGDDSTYCTGETFCTCTITFLPDMTPQESTCVAGYHVQFDPPDRWFDTVASNGPGGTTLHTTKMRAAPYVGGQLGLLDEITPEPGTYVSPVTGELIDEPWYEQAWNDRYSGLACPDSGPEPPPRTGEPGYVRCECEDPDFDPSRPEGPDNPRTIPCEPPPWPGDEQPAPVRNVPRVVPFDDVDPESYDPAVNRRFFKANRGGLNGDGTGWIGCNPEYDRSVVFETGPLDPVGFEQICNAAILPEELGEDGEGRPGEAAVFYDGWVEHDDLPSSKYHRSGDQRLGEVTSPHGDAIWGQDLGIGEPSPYGPDGIIPAAGPYAVGIHGNFGRDAGNLLAMELLTWRTKPPFNNGAAWELDLLFDRTVRVHPYAGPSIGPNLGFRDYNLDGLIDQGEVRPAGSENYVADSLVGTPNDGSRSAYPFNRRRLVEDVVEVLDEVVDFDDLVDADALARINCPDGVTYADVPRHLSDGSNDVIFPNGVCSGLVLLPPGSHVPRDFLRAASYYPIHNEDGDDPEDMLPRPPGVSRLSWNLFFHDLVRAIDVEMVGDVIPMENFQTAYAAHMYLHTWEQFPDLFDYAVFQIPSQLPINCPVGEWDIMARGGLVHPNPQAKEKRCTEWTKPVDLTTVLIPGVEATLTLPPAEFVRDNSYYFIENEGRPRERYYFWSAGSGFDERMPGAGMLVLHTNVGPNPLPPIWPWPPDYLIVQADGLDELQAGTDCGDDGDPWPGSTNARRFNFQTNPPANWHAQNRWTGIDILDIQPDGAGSVAVEINWVPTSIPALRFLNPPGGVSIPGSHGVERYPVNFVGTDVYGGTWMRFFYMEGNTDPGIDPDGRNYIGSFRKVTPGMSDLSLDWNIVDLPDGRYRLFAELIPGEGADGFERSHTLPRPGRYNVGDGGLTVDDVDVNAIAASGTAGFLLDPTTFVASDEDGRFINFPQEGVEVGDQLAVDEIVRDPALRSISEIGPDGLSLVLSSPVTPLPPQAGGPWNVTRADRGARLESWLIECIDSAGTEWIVTSSLTQPRPDELDPDQDPYPHAFTGISYTSIGGEVTFTISEGSVPFVTGDTFTFITTGITATSESVIIWDGEISEDPTAVIHASPLAGYAPLTVKFDGRKSYDPTDGPLEFRWNFGDGSSTESESVVQHTYAHPGVYTVVLRVTNPVSGRIGEAALEITVWDVEPRRGDWDEDGDIDLADYEPHRRCLGTSGPNGPTPYVRCVEVFDFDDDGDVDLRDHARFQAVFTGELP